MDSPRPRGRICGRNRLETVEGQQRTFVVGDVHGCREPLLAALAGRGLVDDSGNWSAGDAHLWFLGDFVDRGPDGIGVIDLVMRLTEQAADAGGQVRTLMGNHEVLLLGTARFGDTEVPSDFGYRSFGRSWALNGGVLADLDALTDEHVAWLSTRPLIAHAADHLLLHSDTLAYLEWGQTADEINTAVEEVLAGDDIVEWWEIWRRLTTRYAFRGEDGGQVADTVLAELGGSRIVHGHSVIADLVGLPPDQITEPAVYADGKVVGIDAGLFVGGPCLIIELPYRAE